MTLWKLTEIEKLCKIMYIELFVFKTVKYILAEEPAHQDDRVTKKT